MKCYKINERMNTKRNFTHCCSNWTMNIFNRNFDRFYFDFFLLRIVVEICFFIYSKIECENEIGKMWSNCCFHSHSPSYSQRLNVNESDSIQSNPWSAHILELANADDDITMCVCVCVRVVIKFYSLKTCLSLLFSLYTMYIL